jgi:hypothetical protein
MKTIAMFSGPRNISTTMMRAFENRADTAVVDEPFYACYLKASGAPHPMRDDVLRAQPNEWSAVVHALKQPPAGGEPIFFQKHIAFHFAGGAPLDWIDDACVFHLIRDPRAMVASYANKYEDVAPVIDSYRMQRLIDERAGGACPVVDARDVLMDPEGVLRALCAALGVDFINDMLAWPAGRRDTDGVWAPHWYDAVEASTGFKPYMEKTLRLTPAQEDVAAQCRDDYEFFHNRRIVVP